MAQDNTPESGPPQGQAHVQVVIDQNAATPTYYANAIQVQLTEDELIFTFALGIPPLQGLTAEHPNIHAQIVARVLVPAKTVGQLAQQLQMTLIHQMQLLAKMEEARKAGTESHG